MARAEQPTAKALEPELLPPDEQPVLSATPFAQRAASLAPLAVWTLHETPVAGIPLIAASAAGAAPAIKFPRVQVSQGAEQVVVAVAFATLTPTLAITCEAVKVKSSQVHGLLLPPAHCPVVVPV